MHEVADVFILIETAYDAFRNTILRIKWFMKDSVGYGLMSGTDLPQYLDMRIIGKGVSDSKGILFNIAFPVI